MQFPQRDLTNQYISTSYQDVVQRYSSGSITYLLDGLGYSLIGIPASSIGGTVLTQDQTASFALTASYAMNGASGSTDSSSWSAYAVTASYAATTSVNVVHARVADYAFVSEIAETASVSVFSEQAESASYALKSSNSDRSITSSYSDYIKSADTASKAYFADLAAHSYTSDWSQYSETSSFALTTQLVSSTEDDVWLDLVLISSSLSGSFSGSLLTDADFDIRYNPGRGSLRVSYISASCITASHFVGTASLAETASSVTGLNFNNTSLSVGTGSNIVVSVSTGSYISAFFDYAVTSGSNIRAGTIFGSWVNNLITFAETSNTDIGDTSQVSMSMALAGDQLQLIATVSSTIPWNIRALGRYL